MPVTQNNQYGLNHEQLKAIEYQDSKTACRLSEGFRNSLSRFTPPDSVLAAPVWKSQSAFLWEEAGAVTKRR